MKLTTITQYASPTNLVIGAVGLAIIAIALSSCQGSCGRRHETNAVVAGAVADTHAAELADLKQQLKGKDVEIASTKEIALTWKRKLEIAKAKIPLTPLPPPVGETALTQSLVAIGLGDDTQVQIGVSSVLNTVDATFVFSLDQEAKRAKALDEALITCAQAVTASEATVAAQTTALDLSARALTQSEKEAAARALQAKELQKALTVEKQKGWRVYVYPAAAIALTLFVKK